MNVCAQNNMPLLGNSSGICLLHLLTWKITLYAITAVLCQQMFAESVQYGL